MTTEANRTASPDESVKARTELAGKYLNFRLDTKYYAFPLLKVREIIRLTDITPVPRTSEFIRGIINLRGKIIPVYDLRRRFGIEAIPDTSISCIIVVDVDELEVGVVVDSVAQVAVFNTDAIERAPSFSQNEQTKYILGIGKCPTYVTLLLDIQNLLQKDEIAEVKKGFAA